MNNTKSLNISSLIECILQGARLREVFRLRKKAAYLSYSYLLFTKIGASLSLV